MRRPRFSLRRITAMIDSIENGTLPLSSYILTFLSVIFLRNFLEDFSDKHFLFGEVAFAFYLHTSVFYLFVLISASLVFHVITYRKLEYLLKLLTTIFAIIIVAPIIDLLFSNDANWDMIYFMPGKDRNMLHTYLTYFGIAQPGLSVGQLSMLTLILIGSIGYFWLRTRSIIRTIIGGAVMYSYLFALSAAPFLAQFMMENLGAPFDFGDMLMVRFYTFILLITLAIAAAAARPSQTIILLKDMRITRVLHLALFFVLGMVIAMKNTMFTYDSSSAMLFVLTPIAIFLTSQFSFMTNNLIDINIDKVTNRTRPLVTGAIDESTYRFVAWIYFLMIVLIAMVLTPRIALLLGSLNATFYLYSMPPLRLKRIPFFSKTFMATGGVVTMLLGFVVAGGGMQYFPYGFALSIFIAFTVLINAIDLKDEPGDRRAGIKTLPVLMGLNPAKMFIGLMHFVTYSLFSILLNNIRLLPPLMLVGCIQFFLITRKNYSDPVVFGVSFLTFAGFIGYIALIDPSVILIDR